MMATWTSGDLRVTWLQCGFTLQIHINMSCEAKIAAFVPSLFFGTVNATIQAAMAFQFAV